MKLKNLATMLVAIAATATLFATPAQATLLGRDINGHAVAGSDVSAVFLYDADLNITWLRDANASATAGNTNDPWGKGYGGFMTWDGANTWATSLTVGVFSGWRLPTTLQPDASCEYQFDPGVPFAIQGQGYECSGSEMGRLFLIELGNKAYCIPGTHCTVQPGWGLTNTGDFQNLYPFVYWSGTEFALDTYYTWFFSMGSGGQSLRGKDVESQLAMAVRPGDVLVASVPEPGTLLLVAAAVAALGVVRRRRAIGTSET